MSVPLFGGLKNWAKWWQISTVISVTAQRSHKQISTTHLWHDTHNAQRLRSQTICWPALLGRVSRLDSLSSLGTQIQQELALEKVSLIGLPEMITSVIIPPNGRICIGVWLDGTSWCSVLVSFSKLCIRTESIAAWAVDYSRLAALGIISCTVCRSVRRWQTEGQG